MGEKQTKPFQLSFNGLLKVDFQGSHVTSDGGLILVRELDERLGLGELIDDISATPGKAQTSSSRSLICCGSRSTAAWRATRTSTTPSGFRSIRRFG